MPEAAHCGIKTVNNGAPDPNQPLHQPISVTFTKGAYSFVCR